MRVQINILHARQAVLDALKICLHYSAYEEVMLFTNIHDLIREAKRDDINLVDADVLMPFLNELKDDIRFSLLVAADNDPRIADALYAGAVSFINISKGAEQFVNQVELIAEGKVDESSQLIRNFLTERLSPQDNIVEDGYNLTKKEIEILKMMREGKHLKLIASNTDTSYETVRTHVKHIYKKLRVVSASEAVIKGMKMKL